MKNKTLIITAVLILIIIGAGLAYHFLAPNLEMDSLETQTPTQSATEPSGESAAPSGLKTDFTVYDSQGSQVKLSDYVGKPVILNFWSSRCGPCKMEMPDFQKAYEKLGEEVHFLMVNVTDGYWDTESTAKDFIEKSGYTFPVFLDLDNSAAGAYGIYSLPSTFFFQTDGTLAAKATGAITPETLQKGIDMIYAP